MEAPQQNGARYNRHDEDSGKSCLSAWNSREMYINMICTIFLLKRRVRERKNKAKLPQLLENGVCKRIWRHFA